MAAIETEALTKDFPIGFWRPRPYRALDGLTLSVGEGEVFGCLGPNGAGKSTTLKLLMQLLYPTSGAARILGRPVGDVSVKRRIGFLPEHPYFYDYLTAEELLTYFASLFGLRGEARRRRASAVLDEVGLGAERRLKLRQCSKGMVQRVGLAQAILNEPEVIFLDEPMSGLDPLGRRDVRQLMLRLSARGCTIFFSSHILSDAEALCSQVAILAQGRLRAQGRLSDLLAFEQKGWELVVADMSPERRSALETRGVRVTPVAHDRYTLDLPPTPGPESFIQDLSSDGVKVVSLNPVHDTLEDLFVREVAAGGRRDTEGLG